MSNPEKLWGSGSSVSCGGVLVRTGGDGGSVGVAAAAEYEGCFVLSGGFPPRVAVFQSLTRCGLGAFSASILADCFQRFGVFACWVGGVGVFFVVRRGNTRSTRSMRICWRSRPEAIRFRRMWKASVSQVRISLLICVSCWSRRLMGAGCAVGG